MKIKKDGCYELELPDGSPLEIFLKCHQVLERVSLPQGDDKWPDAEGDLVRLIHSMRTTFRIPDNFSNKDAIEAIKARARMYEGEISDLRRVLRSEAVVTTIDFPGDMAAIGIAKGCVVGLDKRTKGKAK